MCGVPGYGSTGVASLRRAAAGDFLPTALTTSDFYEQLVAIKRRYGIIIE